MGLLILPLGCGDASDSEAASSRADRAVARFSEPDPRSGAQSDSELGPVRIVSLSPLASRFILALGVEDRLVGVDAESARRPEFADRSVVDIESANSLVPDLVLLPTSSLANEPALTRLESQGIRWVEFAPHDLEDVSGLCRTLARELVGPAASALFEREITRPLALVGGQSPPHGRLRVLGVVDLDPVILAGGHSYETDLIEIGGGSSVTHGGDDSRILLEQGRWDRFAPDLVIAMKAEPWTPEERRMARARVPEEIALDFFSFDRESFWLEGAAQDAERMRILISGRRNQVK